MHPAYKPWLLAIDGPVQDPEGAATEGAVEGEVDSINESVELMVVSESGSRTPAQHSTQSSERFRSAWDAHCDQQSCWALKTDANRTTRASQR